MILKIYLLNLKKGLIFSDILSFISIYMHFVKMQGYDIIFTLEIIGAIEKAQ